MQLKIFTIPITGGEALNEEMNKFLSTHKIIEVIHQFAGDKYWTFCVKYIDGVVGKSEITQSSSRKVDYKEVLGEEEFARFSILRKIRKSLAQEDGIPAFAVFTDAELAEMSKEPELTLARMKSIHGIGKSRVEHYGTQIIEGLEKEETDETPQPSA